MTGIGYIHPGAEVFQMPHRETKKNDGWICFPGRETTSCCFPGEYRTKAEDPNASFQSVCVCVSGGSVCMCERVCEWW